MRTSRSYPILPILLMLAVLVLAACAPAAAQESTAQDAAPGEVEVTYNISDGPIAPDWSLDTLDGGTFQLAAHEGEVVVMFFMASWCSTCILEARALAQLHDKYAEEGLTVVAINVEPQKNNEALSQFRATSNDAAYTWVFDNEYTVTKLYEVKSLDSTVIIDRSGRIAYTDGFLTPFETLETEVKKWL